MLSAITINVGRYLKDIDMKRRAEEICFTYKKKGGGNVLGESAWLVGLQNEPKRRLSLPARIVISPMFSQNEEQRISLSFELYSANWRTWRGYKTGGLEAVDSKREKK